MFPFLSNLTSKYSSKLSTKSIGERREDEIVRNRESTIRDAISEIEIGEDEELEYKKEFNCYTLTV
jgi:hypothetical protein